MNRHDARTDTMTREIKQKIKLTRTDFMTPEIKNKSDHTKSSLHCNSEHCAYTPHMHRCLRLVVNHQENQEIWRLSDCSPDQASSERDSTNQQNTRPCAPPMPAIHSGTAWNTLLVPGEKMLIKTGMAATGARGGATQEGS